MFFLKKQKNWVSWGVRVGICSALIAATTLYIAAEWRVGWDRQAIKCLDGRFWLMHISAPASHVGEVAVFKASGMEPVFKDGETIVKTIRAVAGDTVEIRKDETIWINGKIVAQGLPHLASISAAEKAHFFGKRTLKEHEVWLMGTHPRSYDSRYWGPLKQDKITGRAFFII